MNISKMKNILRKYSKIKAISNLFCLPKNRYYVWGLKPSGIKIKKKAAIKNKKVIQIEDA